MFDIARSNCTSGNLKLLLAMLAMLAIAALAGCASRQNTLNVRHQFTPYTNNSGVEHFDYTMTWYVPPSELFGSQRRSIIASMGLSGGRNNNVWISLDNETRLQLEDVAIGGLEKEMERANSCENGYEIRATKWLDRAIHFSGHCKSK